MDTCNKRKIRNDIILIISMLVVTVIACYFIYFSSNKSCDMQVQILIDGKLKETYDYNPQEHNDKRITLHTGNIIHIKDGFVYMESADCPDGLCIKQGQISNTNESIICLPNKLVVRLVDMTNDKSNNSFDGLDVIAQ